MSTVALASILARAHRDGTLTSTPVNTAIREWIATQHATQVRRQAIALRRMVTIITEKEQAR